MVVWPVLGVAGSWRIVTVCPLTVPVMFILRIWVLNVPVGWPSPLRYERELNLSVTVNEAGVVQILANVIHGSV